MIQDELNTGFRWYNDIGKQNRYKEECAHVCDFKLLTPIDTFLPFMFIIDNMQGTESLTAVSWKVFCDSGEEFSSISTSYLNIHTSTLNSYLSYNGAEISGLYLPCGSYYSEILVEHQLSDESFVFTTYYSEIFIATEMDNPEFNQIDFPLFSAWRWHDNQLKQNRYLENCQNNCGFYLITGSDTLIPFIFRIPIIETPDIQRWVLRNDTCEVVLDETLIETYNTVDNDFTYVFYKGYPPAVSSIELDLPNSGFNDSGSWDSIDEDNAGWSTNTGRGFFIAPPTGLTNDQCSAVFSNEIVPFLSIFAGTSYTVSYTVVSVVGATGSYVQLRVGDTEGQKRYAAGVYKETLVALNNGYVQFYAEKPETPFIRKVEIKIDNVSVFEGANLPCGVFESALTINGVEYFSELVEVIEVLDPTPGNIDYLLLEDGFRLLQENGFGILLEDLT